MDSIKGILSKRVSVVGAISAAILCELLGNVYANAQGGAAGSIPPDTGTAIISGNDYYKQEGETVYEWDKDHWEAEPARRSRTAWCTRADGHTSPIPSSAVRGRLSRSLHNPAFPQRAQIIPPGSPPRPTTV